MLKRFKQVWLADFEFIHADGGLPQPRCLVAMEWHTGEIIRLWSEQLGSKPPYSIDRESLFVSYYASAEVGCHLALGWQPPENILDLFVEFRNITNGLYVPHGSGLVGALKHFGLPSLELETKDAMRQRVMRGGPYSEADRKAIIEYCESDVVSLAKLLPIILLKIEHGLDRALIRGRYMRAAAAIERRGVPIDVDTYRLIQKHREPILDSLISRISIDYPVYENGSFKMAAWDKWLNRRGIEWPRLETGSLKLDSETFDEMELRYPVIAPVNELRKTCSRLRGGKLAIGPDGRNRTMLSAFQSRTGRNQPSNSKSIFGPAKWLRFLIKPQPGYGLAYLDYSQQEFGIAAALSGDPEMIAAYNSDDIYVAFAKRAGALPSDATAESHPEVRAIFKAVVLGTQFGMEKGTLSRRIGKSPDEAQRLLTHHRKLYRRFWEWSDNTVREAAGYFSLSTVGGWVQHFDPDNLNPRAVRNYRMQANGAEILRRACCMVNESGIAICWPIHDALLIEAPLSELDDAVNQCQGLMVEAGRKVLGGFELRVGADVVRYPDRFSDEKGAAMWSMVTELIGQFETGANAPLTDEEYESVGEQEAVSE
jgi:DNA polymerase-1